MRNPEAAVAILRTRGPDPTILLMRRAERPGDAWSGHWSLPGGRRDASDVDLLDTALRELREECGIDLSRKQVSATLPESVARRRTGPFLLVSPFVFDIDAELPTILDENEAVGTMWLPERMLLDPAQHVFGRAPGLSAEMWFPTIPLPGAPLWGFTYRLLVDWLEFAPRECPGPAFEVARMLLGFVLSQGLTLRNPWQLTRSKNGDGTGLVHTAEVSGPIPVEAVVEHLSRPGAHVAKANRVEVRPGYVSLHGLALEEYRIEAVGE